MLYDASINRICLILIKIIIIKKGRDCKSKDLITIKSNPKVNTYSHQSVEINPKYYIIVRPFVMDLTT